MKRLARAVWRKTRALRRPLVNRFALFFEGSITPAVERAVRRVFDDDLGLVLDTLIAEQFRLQQRIEELHDLMAARSGEAVATDHDHDHVPLTADGPGLGIDRS